MGLAGSGFQVGKFEAKDKCAVSSAWSKLEEGLAKFDVSEIRETRNQIKAFCTSGPRFWTST